ncbi:MAG: tetratricopeptide repeat protein [Candidatus Omnitrophica bacterium]|nr:tetratricopeptide repeat protein [Candidatus Omnitrophota bacterium]
MHFDVIQLRKIFFLASLLAILVFIVFVNCLSHQFTYWDDNKYILNNPLVQEFSWPAVGRMFATWRVQYHQYHPLTLLSFAAEYHFFKAAAGVYIFHNLLLHAANTILVFALILILTRGRMFSAWLAAALFGVHPMHVESVAWIVERKDVLYAFFYLAALIFYSQHSRDGKSGNWTWPVFLLFIGSLLSKPAAVTLPLALLLLDYYWHGRLRCRDWLIKTPFFVLSVIFGTIGLAQRPLGLATPYPGIDQIYFGSMAVLTYLWKAVFPVQLSGFYPFPEKINGYYPAEFYAAPFVLIAVTAGLFYLARKQRLVLFGLLFFYTLILLTAGFVNLNNSLLADRYTYVAYIGLFFIAAGFWGAGEGPAVKKRRWCACGIVLLFAVMAWQRCTVWQDGITLWSDVIKKYPREVQAYRNRGSEFGRRGKFFPAWRDFNQALALDPSNPAGYNNRGYLYYEMGKWQNALADFSFSLALDPGLVIAYFNRAAVYIKIGDREKARQDYRQIIKIAPGMTAARQALEQLEKP